MPDNRIVACDEDLQPPQSTLKGLPYIWEPDAGEPEAALSVTEDAQPGGGGP